MTILSKMILVMLIVLLPCNVFAWDIWINAAYTIFPDGSFNYPADPASILGSNALHDPKDQYHINVNDGSSLTSFINMHSSWHLYDLLTGYEYVSSSSSIPNDLLLLVSNSDGTMNVLNFYYWSQSPSNVSINPAPFISFCFGTFVSLVFVIGSSFSFI